ncbi:MAG TPA: nuclear transport factor 2 family protein [Rhodothermales bacterium]|nr:nuclear transport factor 2 family protein [Rhodothermales bacterium]
MTQFADPAFGSVMMRAFVGGDADAKAKAAEAANVQTVERLYAAIVEGTGLSGLCTPDVEFEIVGPPGVPMAGRHVGLAAVEAAAKSNFALLEEQRPVIESVIAQGDEVVVFIQETGRFRPTGRPYKMLAIQHFTVRRGRIVRFRELCDNAVLLEAAGKWAREA